MRTRLLQWVGVAAVLLASGPLAFAQEGRRSWMDPPPASKAPADETVTYPEPPASAAKAVSPPPSASLEESAPEPGSPEAGSIAKAPAPERAGLQTRAPTSREAATLEVTSAGKVAGRKASTGNGGRATRPAAVARLPDPTGAKIARRKEPSREALTRRNESRGPRQKFADGAANAPIAAARPQGEGRPGYRRVRSVQEALDAGLTVTTVRTYRLPDGRRFQVEMEPDPRSRLDLVVRSY
jgi:hypothetical protein